MQDDNFAFPNPDDPFAPPEEWVEDGEESSADSEDDERGGNGQEGVAVRSWYIFIFGRAVDRCTIIGLLIGVV